MTELEPSSLPTADVVAHGDVLPSPEQKAAWLRSGTPRDGFVKIIIKRPSADSLKGYIGAFTSWDPIPPEEHRRGNDQADGPFTEETVDKIAADLKAIIRGERS